MHYKKGMKRYKKAGGKYHEDAKGGFYKGSDGKMYKFEAPGTSAGGDTAGQHDDHAHDEGHEVKGGSMAKSDLDAVLDEVEAMYKSADPEHRKEQLLKKAGDGDLTLEEREELFKALGGDEGDALADAEPSIADELTKGMQENETLQKSLDVSEYLDEQHSELVKSLGKIGEAIDAGDRRNYELQITLAKAIHQIGGLVKGMSARLGVIEQQPVRAPKTKGIPAAPNTMEKGFGGQAPAGDGESMSKSEILDTLEDMMSKAAPDSEQANAILGATAEYEQTGTMSKAVFAQVVEHRRNNAH